MPLRGPADGSQSTLIQHSVCNQSARVGSTTAAECSCAEGYFNSTDNCVSCPDGGFCPGGGTLFAKPGYWRPSASVLTFDKCPVSAACLGVSAQHCVHNESCADYYKGNLCGGCTTGAVKDWETQECQACSEPLPVLKAVGTLLLLLILLAYMYVTAGTASMGSMTILLNFGQCLFLLDSESHISQYFASVVTFNSGSSLVSYVCLGFQAQFILYTLWPVYACLAMTALHIAYQYFFYKDASSQDDNSYAPLSTQSSAEGVQSGGPALPDPLASSRQASDWKALKRRWGFKKWRQSIITALLYTYVSEISTLLRVVQFIHLKAGICVLAVYPALECMSTEHRILLAWSISFFCIFGVLVPLILGWWSINPTERGMLGYLYATYKPHHTWYDFMLLGRRGLLVIATRVPDQGSNVRSVLVSTLLCGSLVIHAATFPFVKRVHNALELFTLVVLFLLWELRDVTDQKSLLPYALDIIEPLVFIVFVPILTLDFFSSSIGQRLRACLYKEPERGDGPVTDTATADPSATSNVTS